MGTHLGDPLPPALAAYYAGLDESRVDDAAGLFGVHGRHAVPDFGVVETGPRTVTTGAAEVHAWLGERERPPWRHDVWLCVVHGDVALVEGVHVDEHAGPMRSFAASARMGTDGLLDRYLLFSSRGARDPIPVEGVGTGDVDAAEVVHDYFADLDAGRFADAAARFSDDVLYSHPPYKHTGISDPGRVEFRGRAELAAAFERRGRTSFGHHVLACVQRGPHAILEGVVDDLPDGGTGSFVSSLTLAADGTIRRYVSYYCEPSVPW